METNVTIQSMTRPCRLLLLPLALVAGGVTINVSAEDGPLDSPLPETTNVPPGQGGVSAPALTPAPGITGQDSLIRAVQEEQDELEALPQPELEERAEDGERAAQVVLGGDFAREAESLAFAPAAANDALADAVRWYNEAASYGFPGAPSLDESGIDFYPIRIQRSQP